MYKKCKYDESKLIEKFGWNEDFLNVQENGQHPIVEDIIGMFLIFYYSKNVTFDSFIM